MTGTRAAIGRKLRAPPTAATAAEGVPGLAEERDQVLLAERVAVGSKQRHRERAAGVVAHRDDFHARSVLRDGASDRGQQQQQAPGKRERAAGDAGHRSGTSVLRRLRG